MVASQVFGLSLGLQILFHFQLLTASAFLYNDAPPLLSSKRRSSLIPLVSTTKASRTWGRRLSSSNSNDNESLEEQQARMKRVRQIQASFYQQAGNEIANDDDHNNRWLRQDVDNPAILCNLPLWRVQWTELPGYQNVLNVHVAHYTHMFRTLLLQHSPPWYFGHVYLPGGSENLGNPTYFLPEKATENGNRKTQATLVGTLMQVTDYVEQDDGRLTLIVQGVGRIRVLSASQQVPYAIASKVQILSDDECWKPHAQRLLGGGRTTISSGNGVDLSKAYIDASQAVAVKESELLRDLEYQQTVLQSENGMIEVSPLSNVNGSASVDFEYIHQQLQDTFSRRLSQMAHESGDDELLLASTTASVRQEDASVNSDVLLKERQVYILLDEMIQLLGRAQPGLKIPVPSQVLGLLPVSNDWPKGFRLHEVAKQLQGKQVGTHSKSPFVRLSQAYPDYPPLRRASRLSYAVWILIENIGGVGRFNKEDYLQISCISIRLDKTIQHLKGINALIKAMIND